MQPSDSRERLRAALVRFPLQRRRAVEPLYRLTPFTHALLCEDVLSRDPLKPIPAPDPIACNPRGDTRARLPGDGASRPSPVQRLF
jgi:hypothetical protein